MDRHGMARIALDAAIELDRAKRGLEADLTGLARLAEALDAAWADRDPCVVMDMLDLIPKGVPRPDTVDELGMVVSVMTARLRAAAEGGEAVREPVLRHCLEMHGALLSMGMRDWGPLHLAA